MKGKQTLRALAVSCTLALADASALLPRSASAMPSAGCPQYVSSIKPLKIGFKWTEGPAWDPANQRWIFSDLMGQTEYGISANGTLTKLRDAGYPNGHALLPAGNFVVAQHDRTLGTVNGDGSNFKVIASTFNGKKLNSPNDVAVAKNGDIYFTDPTFGLEGYGPVKAKPDLSFKGVYRVRDGKLSLINDQLAIPNGIGLSPDEKTLYISDTSNNAVYTLNLAEYTGKPIAAKELFVFKQIKGGHIAANASDGLRVDSKGNIWATGPGGIAVFTPAGKEICGIPFHDHVANLAPGGSQNMQILVTSADKVFLINLKEQF
jgi:gluconolactonase